MPVPAHAHPPPHLQPRARTPTPVDPCSHPHTCSPVPAPPQLQPRARTPTPVPPYLRDSNKICFTRINRTIVSTYEPKRCSLIHLQHSLLTYTYTYSYLVHHSFRCSFRELEGDIEGEAGSKAPSWLNKLFTTFNSTPGTCCCASRDRSSFLSWSTAAWDLSLLRFAGPTSVPFTLAAKLSEQSVSPTSRSVGLTCAGTPPVGVKPVLERPTQAGFGGYLRTRKYQTCFTGVSSTDLLAPVKQVTAKLNKARRSHRRRDSFRRRRDPIARRKKETAIPHGHASPAKTLLGESDSSVVKRLIREGFAGSVRLRHTFRASAKQLEEVEFSCKRSY
eukprot:4263334-Pyramimonas_sp.AAC.1